MPRAPAQAHRPDIARSRCIWGFGLGFMARVWGVLRVSRAYGLLSVYGDYGIYMFSCLFSGDLWC